MILRFFSITELNFIKKPPYHFTFFTIIGDYLTQILTIISYIMCAAIY